MTRKIAERRRTEEALRESEEHLRLLVEGAAEHAMFLLDAEGRVVAWNLGAQRMKGYSAAEILGEDFARFFTAEEIAAGKPRQALEIAAPEGKYTEEAVRVRKDGSTFAASVVLSALRAKDGRLRGYANVTRDVTERRRHEQEMQQLRDEWVSLIAHDLRHPLNIISVAVATLVRHPADKSAVISSAEHIVRSARNLDRMIADLSDFSVLEAKRLKSSAALATSRRWRGRQSSASEPRLPIAPSCSIALANA